VGSQTKKNKKGSHKPSFSNKDKTQQQFTARFPLWDATKTDPRLLEPLRTPAHPPHLRCFENASAGSKSAATVSRPAVYGSKHGDTSLEECPGGICGPPDWAETSSRWTWGLANTNKVGDQHGIKTKIPHQVSSCSIDTKLSVQVPLGMGCEVMQQVEGGFQMPLVQTPPMGQKRTFVRMQR